MPDPRIVTPQEVDSLALTLMAAWEKAEHAPVTASYVATFADMARAVLATEPERTRAAVVKALQDLAETNFYDGDTDRPCDGYYDLIDRAAAIENGADL